jgi:transposase
MDSSCDSVGIDVPESLLSRQKEEPIMSNDTRIAVDVAKAVFELAISDRPGHVACRERLPRGQFLPFMAQQPAATVVMEACGSAHYWAREIQKLGHRVVLLPPHHVRPYIRRNKTDRTDAKGILEASRNEDIRPVPVKTVNQQVLTSLYRLRSGWMLERTARLNALRGLLRELGVFIPGHGKWCRWPGRSLKTPTPVFPMLCDRSSPKRAARSARSRPAFTSWSANSLQSQNSSPPSNTYRRFLAWDC